MSFTDIVSKFNQQADSHSRSQTLNPFSDRFEQSRSPSPRFSREEYGKPVAGSKTDLRGRRAKSHICREILELCTVIHDVGTYNAKKKDSDDEDDGIDDGTIIVSFGELFQIYTKISDKVVGLLIAAKRRGFVYFDREILFQRQDDAVLIALIKPISEIAKTLKADIEQASAPAAVEQTAPAVEKADKKKPSSSDARGTRRPAQGTSTASGGRIETNGRNNDGNNYCNGQVDGIDGGETNSVLKYNVVEISESKEDRDRGARADAIDAAINPERVEDAETEKIDETKTEEAGVTEQIARAETTRGVEEVKTEADVEEERAEETVRAEGMKIERVEGTGEDEKSVEIEGVEIERIEGTEGVERVTTEVVEGVNTERVEGAEKVDGAEEIGGVKTEERVEETEEDGKVKTERVEETEEVEGTGEFGRIQTERVEGVTIEGVGGLKTVKVEGTEEIEGTGEVGVVKTEGIEGLRIEETKEIEGVAEVEVVKTERVEVVETVGVEETEKVEATTEREVEGLNTEAAKETYLLVGGMKTEGEDGSGNEGENDDHLESRVPDGCRLENAKEVGKTEEVSSFFGDNL